MIKKKKNESYFVEFNWGLGQLQSNEHILPLSSFQKRFAPLYSALEEGVTSHYYAGTSYLTDPPDSYRLSTVEGACTQHRLEMVGAWTCVWTAKNGDRNLKNHKLHFSELDHKSVRQSVRDLCRGNRAMHMPRGPLAVNYTIGSRYMSKKHNIHIIKRTLHYISSKTQCLCRLIFFKFV